MPTDHLQRLDSYMNEYQLDILFCRLPENIVYLTGTYPVLGLSIAAYQPGRFIALLLPEFEFTRQPDDRIRVDAFPNGHLGDPPVLQAYAAWLEQLGQKYQPQPKSIGVEVDISIAAPAFNASEMLLPGRDWMELLKTKFPQAALADCLPALEKSRAVKDEGEIAQMRKAGEIANFGLAALGGSLQPGMTEVEAAALVEKEIRTRGTGWQGAQLVQAFAQVTGGPEGSYRQSMLTPSSAKRMEMGDLVMIELGVCVDGYWSDLTRTYTIGKPSKAQVEAYNAVWDAQQNAAQALREGNCWGAPDLAARSLLQSRGYGKYFKHGTGHGIGCRYHESVPRLLPGAEEKLAAGMVTSVEPGIYIPGFGGIRIEDNLVVTAADPRWLSTPAERW